MDEHDVLHVEELGDRRAQVIIRFDESAVVIGDPPVGAVRAKDLSAAVKLRRYLVVSVRSRAGLRVQHHRAAFGVRPTPGKGGPGHRHELVSGPGVTQATAQRPAAILVNEGLGGTALMVPSGAPELVELRGVKADNPKLWCGHAYDGMRQARPSLARIGPYTPITLGEPLRLRGHPGFRLFWAASTISAFGTYITTLAIGVLVVVDLDGSAADVGWVNAARWAPYLVVGLLVGVLADRVRRKPLLVSTDLARAVVLCAVPLFAATQTLSVVVLVCLMAAFGLLSVCNDAAHQSFLPRLLPRAALPRANARLQQSDAVAQTAGPALAGGLVAWLGAPLAVLTDAVSYLVSGVLIALTVIDDPAPERSSRGSTSVLAELREGVRWVYRHPRLRPLALGTHTWFLFNAVLGTVYVPFALRELGMGAGGLGITLSLAGVGAFLGTSLSGWLGRRLSPARILAGARLLEAAGFAVVALTPGMNDLGLVGVVAVAGFGQFLFGLGLGAEGPIELSYRQAVTPDRLQGRTNATMRSVNRAAIVVGAPLGGLLADAVAPRFALLVGVLGVAVSAVALAVSGFRHAAHDD